MTDAQVFVVAGLIALVIALVDEFRTQGQSLPSWAAAVIALALIIVNFN